MRDFDNDGRLLWSHGDMLRHQLRENDAYNELTPKFILLMPLMIFASLFIVLVLHELPSGKILITIVGMIMVFGQMWVTYEITRRIACRVYHTPILGMIAKMWPITIVCVFIIAVFADIANAITLANHSQDALAVLLMPPYAVYRYHVHILEHVFEYAEIIVNIYLPALYDLLHWILVDVLCESIMHVIHNTWRRLVWFWDMLCAYMFHPVGLAIARVWESARHTVMLTFARMWQVFVRW